MSFKKKSKPVLVIIAVLTIIGAWTVVDNTYRLSCAVAHTVTHFNYHPARIALK